MSHDVPSSPTRTASSSTSSATTRISDAPAARAWPARSGANVRVGLTDHGGPTRLEDASLLASDLLERRPQVLRVIESNRRHARDQRHHDVRRVEPPAQARLDDRDVGPAACEIVERHDRRRLEETRANLLDRRQVPRDEVDDVDGGNGLARHHHSLAKVDEMGRRVRRHPAAFRREQRRDRGDAAPLPIRAGDVQHRIRLVRIAKPLEQGDGSLEPELVATGGSGE